MKKKTFKQKVLYYATAPRATIGQISQIVNGDIVDFFVGKLRGIIVSTPDSRYKFGTPEEAKVCAITFRVNARSVATERGWL